MALPIQMYFETLMGMQKIISAQVQSLYPAEDLDSCFLSYENVIGSGHNLLKETVFLLSTPL